jgi:hypothetical protein
VQQARQHRGAIPARNRGRPTRTCSTPRPIASPKSSTACSTPTRGRPCRTPAAGDAACAGQLFPGRQRAIGGPFDYDAGGPGGWWIIDEPELHLDEDILVPDLAGWRRERMPVYPDAAYCTLAPDWVCEILSPSTRKLDLHGKRPVYAREGVEHLWLVDPADRTLEALELRKGHWVLIATAQDDAPVRVRPFEAVTFSRGDLWP